jgi:NADPH-dependent 2,4-dienoyl-CoA reductase/sulfur reductase-like enzyme
VMASGTRIRYDRLLLATGSSPRTLDLPGADLDGVHSLRTLDDSEWLHSQLKGGGRRLTLIGSGWIGLEVAATARELGNEVTVLEHVHVPLSSAIGDELGQLFVDLHAEHGVVIKTGVEVLEISGIDGKVAGVKVGGIAIVRSDLVLIAVGAAPNVSLAVDAGLEVDNGITVDSSLRTSDPKIFAAGDVARAWHPVAQLSLRSEHWANALNQGKAAARSMLGLEESYDEIPYFYTDQYDLGMEYSGYGALAADATLVYRGSKEDRTFIVFWVADGKVVAGMNVNVWDVNEDIQGIIRRGNQVDVAALANPEVALSSL